MSRFEPPPDPSGPPTRPTPQPPARPPAVELAAAILIVGGAVNLVGAVLTALGGGGADDPFLWLTLSLNATSVVLGLLVRIGRLWLVAVNFAAVLGFLDLLGASVNPAALMLGLAEILVVVILIRHKPWFDERRQPLPPPGDPRPATRARGGRSLGPPGAMTVAPDRRPSALDAADGEAADEISLEDEEDDRDGQGEQDREGRELRPVRRSRELADEAVEGE